eukprot:scaffold138993_cov15-Tisochrysis_lutea.AAC.1
MKAEKLEFQAFSSTTCTGLLKRHTEVLYKHLGHQDREGQNARKCQCFSWISHAMSCREVQQKVDKKHTAGNGSEIHIQ